MVGKISNFKEHLILTTAKAYGLLDKLDYVINNICPKYEYDDISIPNMRFFKTDNDEYKVEIIDNDISIDETINNIKIPVEYFALYENKEFPDIFNGLNDFHDWLEHNNFVILSNGVIVDHNIELPIVSKIIAEIMDSRSSYKKKMFECESNGQEDLAKIYNTYQKAVKVLNNSCFTPDHSVITLDGIKNIKNVNIGDELYNFNPKNRKMEKDVVIDTIEKPYNDFIYNIKNYSDTELKFDFSTTKDHKFVLEDINGGIVIKTAEELYNEYSNVDDSGVLYYFPSTDSKDLSSTWSELVPNDENFDDYLNEVIKRGYSVRFTVNTNDIGYKFNHVIRSNRKIAIYKEDITKEKYNGKVYCITTEKNHTLMAGKNNTFNITHNCYGVLANSSFRMYNINIASGITSCGQSIIRASTYCLNNYINSLFNGNEDNIITNDTDSIIFTLQNVVDYPIDTRDEEILKKISGIAVDCQNYVNDIVYDINKNIFMFKNVTKDTNFLKIKTEWLANTGLFIAKKNYAINMVFNEGHPKEELIMMGISLKRSTIPEACKPYIKEILQAILDFKDKDEIDKMVIKNTDAIMSLPMDVIGLTTSIKNINTYKVNAAHVRGALIWNKYFAKNEMDKIYFGKVKQIFVKKWKNNEIMKDPNNNIISVPDAPKYWEQVKDEFVIDEVKMKDRLVIKNIDKFYTAMQWKMPSALYTDTLCVFRNGNNKKKSKIKMI